MTPALEPEQEPPAPAAAGDGDERPLVVSALTDNGLDAQRLQSLRAVSLKGAQTPLVLAATEQARLVWARTTPRTDRADRKSMPMVAYLLLADGAEYGDISPRRALTREAVDRYLVRLSSHRETRSIRTYKSTLYAAGRVFYPQSFPALRTVRAPRGKARPSSAISEVRDYYATLTVLSPTLRGRLVILLDLCTGAGLSSAEVKSLRGNQIRVINTSDGTRIAIVTVTPPTGKTREIPVTHPAKAGRLLDLAERVGSGFVLPSAHGKTTGRNTVNRISEDLQRAGHRGVGAAALRNRWILDLAASVPAALLLQLAGVSDLRVLADQRELLPQYDIDTVIAILREAGL